MRALLDVNFLVALFDPDHQFHDAAHAWWKNNQGGGWASCPLTENGLVRILSNPNYSVRFKRSCEAVIEDLKEFLTDTDHRFWPDSVTVRDAGAIAGRHLKGPKQLTDVYLLALAVANGGRLVSLDAHIPLHAVPATKSSSLVLVAASP